MKNVIVLGASGMAGHLISIYLKENGYNVLGLARRSLTYVNTVVADVLDFDNLQNIILENKVEVIVNCVGILNQFAENNKAEAVLLNTYLPHYLAEISNEYDIKLIHMSTDCVFSGKTGSYTEKSFQDGETFYDRTKALGEVYDNNVLTFRNSIIGPDINENGIGLFNWFMKQEGEVNGFSKAIWTGVTTLELAKNIDKAIKNNVSGLYHLVNNDTINKYELLCLFNKYFKNNELKININDKFVIDKSLVNTRTDFDFTVPSYEQMIIEMKQWIIEHKSIYNYNIGE